MSVIELIRQRRSRLNAHTALRHPSQRGFRIGIGTTLIVAFLAVATLAAVANLISERGLDVVDPLTLAVAGPIVPAASKPVIETAPPVEPRSVTGRERFLSALDRYDLATRNRAGSDGAAQDIEFRSAARQLRDERAALLDQLEHRSHLAERDGFNRTFQSHTTLAKDMIQSGDAARDLVDGYVAGYETMRTRARTAIDHAWKIFGRIIARQSLIELNRQIEELGNVAADLERANRTDQSTSSDALSIGEAAIGLTLATNLRGFANSQGEEWVAAMQDDLAFLSSTRVALAKLNDHRQDASNRFARTRSQLKVPSIVDLANEQPKAPPMVEAPAPALVSLTPMTSRPLIPAPDAYQRSAIIAWVSGGVLLLLIVISFVTVRSVVGPVRRLVNATVRLAQGEMDARVRPGGIKELDTLAHAFNSMAERLALAERAKREYQQQLEAKVQERTEQLKHLASNDPLTALPNHRQLFTLLNQALGRGETTGSIVGVYFLDIDNFKNINDGMGHAYGDSVLKAMAERLRSVANEFGFAARLGGDEFTVVIDNATTLEEIREAGERLVRVFHAPLTVDGRDLALSISVGASVFPHHGHTAETLLQAADAALFRAKALGRSQLVMYSPDLLAAASAKFAVEQGLRKALENGEFELVYQPEFGIDGHGVELVEALLRWRRPDGRLASPGEFLAVAEESGLIMDMSDWVLRTAVATAARWHHGMWPQARVAVNVSSRQLIDSFFVARIKALLIEYRLPPRCIEIELTETVLQTGAATLEALRQLRAHGIAIALDDFGTGYSSLASLQQLPLTRIKLDRSLVNDIDTSPRAFAIAHSIISLAKSLELEVTAEGIERQGQLALLTGERPLVVQGFLFSRPLSETELIGALPKLNQRSRELLAARPKATRKDTVARRGQVVPLAARNQTAIPSPHQRLS